MGAGAKPGPTQVSVGEAMTSRISPFLVDHANSPRNNGPLIDYDGRALITGPCGDTMEFWVKLVDERITKVSFVTDGCGTAHACGSMATVLAEGKSLEEISALSPEDILQALGGLPEASQHCALLAATTLKAACEARTEPVDAGGTAAQKAAHPYRIAIPVSAGRLSAHFGHCECFALMDVDRESAQVVGRTDVPAPPHEPGLLPPWLAERGALMVVCGGMGQRAQTLFEQQGIQVVVGAPAETPEHVVQALLAGSLQLGENYCDH